MDEARRVIERLERISELRSGGAAPHRLLDELRALLEEGEAWLAREGVDTDRAAVALGDVRDALAAREARTPARREVAKATSAL